MFCCLTTIDMTEGEIQLAISEHCSQLTSTVQTGLSFELMLELTTTVLTCFLLVVLSTCRKLLFTFRNSADDGSLGGCGAG